MSSSLTSASSSGNPLFLACIHRVETPPTERKSDPTGQTVRERSRSIEEQLSHAENGEEEKGTTNRSDILSRISKMGQPMLPMATGSSGSTEAVQASDLAYSCPFM